MQVPSTTQVVHDSGQMKPRNIGLQLTVLRAAAEPTRKVSSAHDDFYAFEMCALWYRQFSCDLSYLCEAIRGCCQSPARTGSSVRGCGS